MRRIMGLLALMAAAVPACTAQSGGDLKNTLFGLSNQFMVEWQKHYAAGLNALMAPEFVYVAQQGPIPRAGVVNDLMNHCTLAGYKFGEPQMLQAGADAAVLIYTLHSDLTCFGQPAPPDAVNTDTFVRRGGRWLLLMTTAAPLMKPPAAP